MTNKPDSEYTLGVDISRWDVLYNDYTKKIVSLWNPDNSIKKIDFVIQKCSDGKLFDPFVNELYEQTLKIPIRGAYHYFRTGIGWKVQLDTILKVIENKKYHFFAIDYEKFYNELNATSFAEMMELVKQLKLATGKKVLIYFNADIYQNNMKPYNADAVINQTDGTWFAQYPWKLFLNLDNPPTALPKNIKNLKIFQFGGDVPLTRGFLEGKDWGTPANSVDINLWYGSVEEMKVWAGVDDSPIITPPPIEPPHPENKSRYTGNVLGIVNPYLNIRDKAITGNVIGKLYHDDYFEADALDSNNWFHLTFPSTGYISSAFTKYIDNDKLIPTPTNKNLGLYYVIPRYRTGTNGPALSPCSRNTKMFDNASHPDYNSWSKYLLEINKYDNLGKEKYRLEWIDDPLGGPTKGVGNGKYKWIGLAYPGNVVLVEDIINGENGQKWAKIKSVSNTVVPNPTKINYIKTPYLVHQCFGWNSNNELFPLIGNKGGCVVPVVGESNWYIPMSELQPIHVAQNMNIRNIPSVSGNIVGNIQKGKEVYFSELNERKTLSDDLWGKLSDNSGWVAIKIGSNKYTDWKFI